MITSLSFQILFLKIILLFDVVKAMKVIKYH